MNVSVSLPAAMRRLLAQALPILVAQLASIGMMLVDTVVLGHVSPEDLAAVAIGSGIVVSIVFALVGIVQAVAPVAAHLHGARRDGEVAGVLQQGFWLAALLALPGMALLLRPQFMLEPFGLDAVVTLKVEQYLNLLAWYLPAAIFYRTFYAFCSALGRPRVLMGIGLFGLGVHAVLAWGLAQQGWLGEPLGVVGCAISNVAVVWLECLCAALWLHFGPLGKRYQPFRHWRGPRWESWRELLRLGVPMGLSNLIEITAFTLVSLFVASLGAAVVGGHRIIANLSALAYMLPLSLGIATMAAVGQALGARAWAEARCLTRAGLWLATVSSVLTGLLLWLAARPVIAAYTDDPAVQAVALALIGYVAVYQFVDALQTVAGHVLRACRVTFAPMLIQMFCFWGIALGGGAWLCYRWTPPLGVAGFWLAAVIALAAAAALLLPLMYRVLDSVTAEG
jgi:MATE family multidrug resistance protein